VIYKAGQPEFWAEQFSPTNDLLSRAKQYIGILANAMELQQQHGVFELLQGETIALLLKSTGAALSKPLPEVAADSSNRSPAGRHLQQHGTATSDPAANSNGDSSSAKGLAFERDEVVAEKLQCLRALVVLMHLLGADLGSHAYQVCTAAARWLCWLLIQKGPAIAASARSVRHVVL
jgi:hypothetical protein